ncbi:AraC family transcriptional regulator [Lysinibacillus telephonicus]|uniref:AraC family transcriptional regulator n=1 Tax=Lysinibacillus telephonicus TaxID=1714840 RepID=A0A3S0HC74_9BACI|nr:helix-turn-helix domain-containing protein [Lysinibacillus telephonicus]RTQ86472.1 AraC family transcriptional regulator [Lysinibacillus telephonicus]
MRYKEIKPPVELDPYVKCFWFLNRDYKRIEDNEVLWPDGCYELIFHFGSSYEINDRKLEPEFLIGSLTRYHILNAKGNIRLFGIRLKPWGLKFFSDIDVKNLRNQLLPLKDIFDNEKIKQVSKVIKGMDLEEGMLVIKDFLIGLRNQKNNKELPFIKILSEIYDDPIGQDLQSVIEKSNYSRRQFERKTTELTGLSPKKLSKVARFNQVRLKIFFNPEIDLHDCMVDYGYYDYAHFSKDFKESIGLTPKEYKNWILKKINLNNKQNGVVFLQEE